MKTTDNNGKVYINADGKRVMRVTEVIKYLSKEGLEGWANMLGFKHIDYKKELARTANIGTMVHSVIENFFAKDVLAVIDYDEYEVWGFQSRLEASNAISSFFKWYDDHKDIYKIKFTERVVVGKNLGGTIDTAIEGFKNKNKVILIDYKTASGIYLSMFLQLIGYVIIYEEVYGEDTVEGVMVIQMDKKNGDKANARFISREKLEPLIMAFQCLYNTAVMMEYLNGTWYELTDRI